MNIISFKYRFIAGLVAALLATLALSIGMWRAGAEHVQDKWTLAQAQARAEAAEALTAAQTRTRQAEALAAQRLITIDTQYKALDHARNSNETLRRQLATGAIRVRINTASPAGNLPTNTSPASLDDGKTACELDGALASELAGIASDGDRAIRQLSALQDYVREVVGPVCGAGE